MSDSTQNLRDTVYVARQPILRSTGKVFGYELLYRGAAAETSCTASTDTAGARTITDAVLSLGLDTLTGRLPAFINLDRSLLLGSAPSLLSPKSAVLEVLEDTAIDDEVIDTCRLLQRKGYALALDDFVEGSDAEALLPYVKYVKVDVLTTPPLVQLDLARRLTPLGIQLIAEKVETPEVADDMRRAGYKFLQGYYFCRPTTFRAKALPARSMTYMNLIAALNRPDLCAADLEDLIKTDVSLSYRVLRCVNSFAYALHQEIRSIRHALVMLGLDKIQGWATIWLLAGVNVGGIPETLTVALVRARTCEILGEALSGAETGAEYFLLGLCSLLDVMLEQSMEQALAELPLSREIRSALLGEAHVSRSVLDAVIAYERGLWDEATNGAASAGLSASLLSEAYGEALKWSRALWVHAVAS